MKSRPARPDPLKLILLQNSDVSARRLIARLERAGYPCAWIRLDKPEALLTRLERFSYDLVVCDDRLSGANGFDSLSTLQALREKDPIVPFLLLSPQPNPVRTAEAFRHGATDALCQKEIERLPAVIERALKEARVQRARRQSELALLSSEQKLRTIFDQMLDVIVVIHSATGTLLSANRAATTILGYEEKELLGKHFSLFFPPKAPLGPDALLKRLWNEGPVFESQSFQRADGTLCPMDLTASLLPWGKGEAVLCVLRDVTGRRHVDEALRMTQFAVDHCQHLILWTGPDGQLRYVNETACQTLGYTRSELLSLHISAIDPSFGPNVWPIHWEEVRNYGTFTLESALRRKDGTTLPVETVVNYFSYQGQEYNCAIVREKSDRAHAIEAPPSIPAEPPAPTSAPPALFDFVSDLRDLSLLQSGKLDLRLDRVAVSPLCHATLDLMREAARARNIHLFLSGADGDLTLHADPRRLRQMLLHLLSNAVKFTPDGGTVRLEIDHDPKEKALLFHVIDTGIGIEETHIPRLFQPFALLGTNGKPTGSGIGLALVHHLTRLHQGEIAVESVPGAGSRFTLKLPTHLPLETKTPPTLEAEHPPRPTPLSNTVPA